MKKRIAVIFLASLFLITLFAGCSTGGSTTTTAAATTAAGAATTTAVEKKDDITVNMWIVENPSYLYAKDLVCERAINAATGVYFNVTPFQDGITDKINLGLASGELPDLAAAFGPSEAAVWGLQGALVNYEGKLTAMPNYQAWLAAQQEGYTNMFYTADGGLYVTPQIGYGMGNNSTIWEYRKDLFEKYQIAVPKTEVELHDACLKLKEAYPDSYPLANRSWPGILDRIVWQWGGGYGMYYSNADSAWIYGSTAEPMKECITWLHQMWKDELIPTNWFSMTTADWQEIVSTNKGFVFNDYYGRLDTYTNAMKTDNPDVQFAFMDPFEGGGSGVKTFNAQSQLLTSGYVTFVSSPYIDRLLDMFDWMYSEDGITAMNWGIEGESYTVNADGTKSHIGIVAGQSNFFDYPTKYGFYQRGFYLNCDTVAMNTFASESAREAIKKIGEFSGEYRLPAISWSDKNLEQYNILNDPINTAMQQALGDFVSGQRSLDDWDAYVQEIEKLGLQDLINLYNTQQKEINEKLGK